ncbi:LOW QUALITY PROTEIN: hypothetical protein PHMEG_00022235 [Phytophthora megakarya]|uniref:Uncharacterized protein n=1 Tax=Phytophthora megakarya TaxID=4795 RepID=A0A225VJA2_9STRA|nr:LOW QUALITY PROTEIN: hypothetical protein PHMEG_00022235 [Phytophthora megakarya]
MYTGQKENPDQGDSHWIIVGIRLYLAHGSISLPDEGRIQLSGRQQLYSDKSKIVNVGRYLRIETRESVELPLRLRSSIHDKLWVTPGNQWVPTISDGPGRPKYISITNIGDEVLILHQDQRDLTGRRPCATDTGFHLDRLLSLHGNLALEATTDTRFQKMEVEVPLVPAEERSEYATLRAIPQRSKAMMIQYRKAEASQDHNIPDCLPSDKSPSKIRPLDLASVASKESDLSSIADEDPISHAVTIKEALVNLDQVTTDVSPTNPSL